MEKIKLNFILEDYTIFRNKINEALENKDILKRLDESTKIKSHETELGILTIAEIMIQKEDLEIIAKTLTDEYNKSVWARNENRPLLAITEQLIRKTDNPNFYILQSLEMLVQGY